MNRATFAGVCTTLIGFFIVIVAQSEMPQRPHAFVKSASHAGETGHDLAADDMDLDFEDDSAAVHQGDTHAGGHGHDAYKVDRHTNETDGNEQVRSPDEASPQFRSHLEKMAVATKRIQHIRLAAENLKAADLNNVARQLIQRAEAMERDVHAARMQMVPEALDEHSRELDQLQDVVRDLRNEVDRLRKESTQPASKDEAR